MPEAGRRRRAPPSQIQITFTLRAKDQFSKERGRKETEAAARERGREAVARGGQWRETGSGSTGRERERRSEPAELEGERGRREASGRARDAPEIHGQGGLNGRAAPAGRPLGSCYTAGAAAASQPRRRAPAARRGPRGHDDALGDAGLWLPAPRARAAQPGDRGARASGGGLGWAGGREGQGPRFPTRDRGSPGGPGTWGCEGPSPPLSTAAGARPPLPNARDPPHESANWTGSDPEESGPHSPAPSPGPHTLPATPGTSQKTTLSAKKNATSGEKSVFNQSPSPASLGINKTLSI